MSQTDRVIHSNDNKPNNQIQIKKNRGLRDMTQCSICYTQYDAQDHIPLMLTCGHTICQFTADKIYFYGELECPLCKHTSRYDTQTAIPKNFTLLELISLQTTQPKINIEITLNNQIFQKSEETILRIKDENQKIEKIFAELKQRKEAIIEFNNKLLRHSEIFVAKNQVQRNSAFEKHFDKLQNFMFLNQSRKDCEVILNELKDNVEKVNKNVKFVSFSKAQKDFANIIKSKPIQENRLNFKDLKSQNLIFKDELVHDYNNLLTEVDNNIIRHSSSVSLRKRKYLIKNRKNLEEILKILAYESNKNNQLALNTLGFLYYHGIEVQVDKGISFEKFKKSATQGNSKAIFACFCQEENLLKKYSYLEDGLQNLRPKTFATLGFLINRGKLDDERIKTKLTTLLYKIGAQNKIPIAMFNYADKLRLGKGIEKNIEESCEFFYTAIQEGYFEAKEYLDEVSQLCPKFIEKYPDYKVLESGNYEEYAQNQEIILL